MSHWRERAIAFSGTIGREVLDISAAMREFSRMNSYSQSRSKLKTDRHFPLRGVIGVVANSAQELEQALAAQLQCVEIRADLLLDNGLSTDDVLALAGRAKTLQLGCLMTLRHPAHGGKFTGSEEQRVAFNRRALAAGADVIDLEWDTDAAAQIGGSGVPLILSYHNFHGMPDNAELARITSQMSASRPLGIKVVPSAATLSDAIRMLHWVQSADSQIARIGFAMGNEGACSRILTTVFGAPVTYASFGPAVAPGQIELTALLEDYRAMELNADTSVFAVLGDPAQRALKVRELNRAPQIRAGNSVAIGFAADQRGLLEAQAEALNIVDIQSV